MNKNLIIIFVLVAAMAGGGILTACSGGAGGNNAAKPKPTPGQASEEFKKLLDAAPPGAQPAWSKGDPTAKVVIEEFADFACPTCANFNQSLKEIEKSYGSRVRVIYHHFPLQIKGHENAYDASRAAEAAGIQGRFWEMQNMIFMNQEKWRTSTDAKTIFADYAKSIGIDVEKFKADMAGQIAAARVADDMRRANAIKVNSTPTVILNGRMLAAGEITSTEGLRQAIETELQKAAAPPAETTPNTGTGNTNANK